MNVVIFFSVLLWSVLFPRLLLSLFSLFSSLTLSLFSFFQSTVRSLSLHLLSSLHLFSSLSTHFLILPCVLTHICTLFTLHLPSPPYHIFHSSLNYSPSSPCTYYLIIFITHSLTHSFTHPHSLTRSLTLTHSLATGYWLHFSHFTFLRP